MYFVHTVYVCLAGVQVPVYFLVRLYIVHKLNMKGLPPYFSPGAIAHVLKVSLLALNFKCTCY